MSGASSGVNQQMLPPSIAWINPQTGAPTQQFFELIRALLNRTGGTSAPGGGGSIGLAYLQSEIDNLTTEMQLALELGTMGLLMDDDGAVVLGASDSGQDGLTLAAMNDDGPYASVQVAQMALLLSVGVDESPTPDPNQATLLALMLDGDTSTNPSSATSTGYYAPLVTGALPGPVAISTADGQFIMIPVP